MGFLNKLMSQIFGRQFWVWQDLEWLANCTNTTALLTDSGAISLVQKTNETRSEYKSGLGWGSERGGRGEARFWTTKLGNVEQRVAVYQM
jgi:uncharacterized protein CbrC (UPF0167 family)